MHTARAIAVLLSLSVSNVAYAAGWVKAPGDAYVKVSGSTFSTDQVVDADGVSTTTPWTYTNRTITTYLEVGIARDFGLNVSLPFTIADNTYDSFKYERSGLTDLNVGLSYALGKGRCPVAADLSASFPLYDGVVGADAQVGATGGDDPTQRYLPMLGDGALELAPGLSVGCSLHPIPVWLTARVAYQLRNEGFGDGIKTSFGAGGYIWPKRVALVAGLDVVQRFDGNNERPTKSYLSVYGGALVALGLGLSAEATVSYVPSGVFVATGTTYSLGLSYTGRIFPDPY